MYLGVCLFFDSLYSLCHGHLSCRKRCVIAENSKPIKKQFIKIERKMVLGAQTVFFYTYASILPYLGVQNMF